MQPQPAMSSTIEFKQSGPVYVCTASAPVGQQPCQENNQILVNALRITHSSVPPSSYSTFTVYYNLVYHKKTITGTSLGIMTELPNNHVALTFNVWPDSTQPDIWACSLVTGLSVNRLTMSWGPNTLVTEVELQTTKAEPSDTRGVSVFDRLWSTVPAVSSCDTAICNAETCDTCCGIDENGCWICQPNVKNCLMKKGASGPSEHRHHAAQGVSHAYQMYPRHWMPAAGTASGSSCPPCSDNSCSFPFCCQPVSQNSSCETCQPCSMT